MADLAKVNPRYKLYQAFWSGLDWLIPPTCGGCGRRGTRWCEACQAKTRIITGAICDRCGIMTSAGGLCVNCQLRPPPYTAARSWALYTGELRKALHRLKYKRDIGLAEYFAHPMVDLVRQLGWKADLVIPVPMTPNHLKERGYNQARLLSEPIALSLNIRHVDRGLRKIRETVSQVNLRVADRAANVFGAFQAEPSIVREQIILLVDDIMTTGSTLTACSHALRSAGASEIYCMTLARAQQEPDPFFTPPISN